MTRFLRALRPLSAAALLAASAHASAVDLTLTFSGNICGAAGNQACGNSSQIGQNYGDIAGVLDVSHRSFVVATGNTYENFVKYWDSGYSGLTGVAWGGANGSQYGAEFTFTPTAGQVVTLKSFDFGDYQNRNNGSSAQILDLVTGQVLWSSGAFNPGLTPTSFATSISSANGLVLRWGADAYDTGIDNIALSVTTAVPEPGAWAMLLAGLGMLGVTARRRRG